MINAYMIGYAKNALSGGMPSPDTDSVGTRALAAIANEIGVKMHGTPGLSLEEAITQVQEESAGLGLDDDLCRKAWEFEQQGSSPSSR